MNEYIALALGILLCFGTGLFVAAEFSMVSLSRDELVARQEKGETGLRGIIRALEHTSTHLSSAQLGITLTTLLAGYLLEPSIGSLIRPALISWGMSAEVIAVVSPIIAMLLATLLSMIIGELAPKNFAIELPLMVGKFVIPFQTAFTWLFKPLIKLLNGSANAILRGFGIEPKEQLSAARNAQELTALLRHSAEEGTLEKDTADLLTRSLRLQELTAGEVLTPRMRLVSINKGASVAEVLEFAGQSGHSRFPVTDEDVDDVVGLVHLKQAVAVPLERRREVPVASIMTEIERVPETIKLDSLLGILRGRGYQMVVVVDEYGGTSGIVTLEDLVEEVVGDLDDEHDRSHLGVVRHSNGQITFSATLRPDELMERAGISVPESGDYETIAGFVLSSLGKLAEVGDEVAIDSGMLRVERLDGRRVDRIRYIEAVDND